MEVFMQTFITASLKIQNSKIRQLLLITW